MHTIRHFVGSIVGLAQGNASNATLVTVTLCCSMFVIAVGCALRLAIVLR